MKEILENNKTFNLIELPHRYKTKTKINIIYNVATDKVFLREQTEEKMYYKIVVGKDHLLDAMKFNKKVETKKHVYSHFDIFTCICDLNKENIKLRFYGSNSNRKLMNISLSKLQIETIKENINKSLITWELMK